MTDYLERMIQGGGETLARALRRVEAALEAAALAAGEADREEKRESARAALDREPETDAGRRRDPANVRRSIGGGPYRNEERREEPPVLLEQLKALEGPLFRFQRGTQAGETSGGTAAAGAGSGGSYGGFSRQGREPAEWAAASQTGLWSGGNGRTDSGEVRLPQAEEVDRVFRRDSRRYDGGFFLY